jgi:transcriptional regulator with XRE-family HTH domain
MISNQRQYRITKAQLEKLKSAIADLHGKKADLAHVHPVLVRAQEDALSSQVEELREQLAEFDALTTGREKVLEVGSFEELPKALIRARIAAGLSQKELADRLGLKEQQVQRYEATEYASASLARLRAIVDAIGIKVREEVFLPNADVSPKNLTERLDAIGISRDFVLKRLLPRELGAQLLDAAEGKAKDAAAIVLRAAGVIGRVFGWSPAVIFTREPIPIDVAALGTRFKLPGRTDDMRLSVYTLYAHYLALLVLQATPDLSVQALSDDPQVVRAEILSRFGSVDLKAVLEYVWSKGIPVLPLQDSGAFHGACWRAGGRNVIALKQVTASQSRWLFDLLHEYWEATQETAEINRAVVEGGEPLACTEDKEIEANRFAGDVLLDNRAEELAQQCAKAAGGSVEKLKAVVPQVARRADVSVDALANYMAFRLTLDRVNWWGAANNLQTKGTVPFVIARDALMSKVDLTKLNSFDADVLLRAVSSQEE